MNSAGHDKKVEEQSGAVLFSTPLKTLRGDLAVLHHLALHLAAVAINDFLLRFAHDGELVRRRVHIVRRARNLLHVALTGLRGRGIAAVVSRWGHNLNK